jgi:hypothetical protein
MVAVDIIQLILNVVLANSKIEKDGKVLLQTFQ